MKGHGYHNLNPKRPLTAPRDLCWHCSVRRSKMTVTGACRHIECPCLRQGLSPGDQMCNIEGSSAPRSRAATVLAQCCFYCYVVLVILSDYVRSGVSTSRHDRPGGPGWAGAGSLTLGVVQISALCSSEW